MSIIGNLRAKLIVSRSRSARPAKYLCYKCGVECKRVVIDDQTHYHCPTCETNYRDMYHKKRNGSVNWRLPVALAIISCGLVAQAFAIKYCSQQVARDEICQLECGRHAKGRWKGGACWCKVGHAWIRIGADE